MATQATTHGPNPGVGTIQLSGRLDAATSETITAEVRQALAESPAGVIIDLKDVSYVSSAGLRMFLTVYKSAKAIGKNVAIIQAQPAVYKIFKVASMETVFHIFDSQEMALRALWPVS